jgi:peptide/nickel transport system permease protein
VFDLKGYMKYFTGKIAWYLLTLVVAIVLNFLLPRMMPGNPVANIATKAVSGMTDANAIQDVYESYTKMFGLDKSLPEQFVLYISNLFKGDLGTSFTYYPREVSDLIGSAVGWTIALQLPAILIGWLLGNILGAIAAYIRGSFDKVIFPTFLFISNVPAFGMAIILLFA